MIRDPARPRIDPLPEPQRSEAERLGALLHDVGNLLTIVVGRLELLSIRKDLTVPTQEGVNAALKASVQMSHGLADIQETIRQFRGKS